MADTSQAPAARKRSGLNGMLIADLKSMANGLGIAGADSMRKAQLVEAIKARQSSGGSGDARQQPQQPQQPQQDQPAQQPKQRQGEPKQGQGEPKQGQGEPKKGQQNDQNKNDQGKQQDKQQNKQRDSAKQNQGQQNQNQQNQNQQGQQNQDGQDDDAGGSRRNRRRRARDRSTPAGAGQGGAAASRGRGSEPDTQILEDDVLVPAAGILDVLDNYAFVRTSGYLPGADDVYLSLSLVRKYGLRAGDAVVGQVRQPREGERKEKFNPMVRIDSVNGSEPDAARHRPDFASLTPVHPSEQLRLETGPEDLLGRLVDLTAPLGKGQRALVLAAPRVGRTTVLQSLADSIATNHPEAHLMVVLVDERPEEVTDYQRSVKGEVIAATLDRAPHEHTALAELAVQRAQRLVELGHDVVLLVDGLTRLGRALTMSGPGQSRSTGSGMDSQALHQTRRLFGCARKLEDAGSLTMIATVSTGTGLAMDEMLLADLVPAANSELVLSSDLARQGVRPAVDVRASGTRREELLMSTEEHALRRQLRAGLDEDPRTAWETMAGEIRKTAGNIELLMRLKG